MCSVEKICLLVLLYYSTFHALLEDGAWECGEATGGVNAAGIDQAPQVCGFIEAHLVLQSPHIPYPTLQIQAKQIIVEVG
jgi:hypothetical protein